MLTWLDIRDFVIVKKLSLSFDEGLTVITGETGAGKSILVDALSLLLGDRADSNLIHHSSERAEIHASFDVPDSHPAAGWLRQQDLFHDQECVLRRILHKHKSSKAFINGRPVTLQQLRLLGETLVDVHSQHEHQSLMQKSTQREILDRFADITESVTSLNSSFHRLVSIQEKLGLLTQQSADQTTRLELLRHQVSELESLAPTENEYEELVRSHKRLNHAQELISGSSHVLNTLYEAEQNSISEQIRHSARKLEDLGEHDEGLSHVLKLLEEAGVQIDEAANELRQRRDRYELDPNELNRIEARLTALTDLARKHHVEPALLGQVLVRLQTELNDIGNTDETLAALQKELDTEEKYYVALAEEVTDARKKAANKLGRAITNEIHELGMGQGNFRVHLDSYPENKKTAHGLESVEFLVSANPGQPFTPLYKTASGGELSRISLAIQVVCADGGAHATQIFDEVDVGIGGAIAEVVGKKLKTLSRTKQILCITHLPQVASQGQHHLCVQKSNAESVEETQVSIETMDESQRVEEIARMLGGLKITKQTKAHAAEMLSQNLQ